jgi:hypothetical protein
MIEILNDKILYYKNIMSNPNSLVYDLEITDNFLKEDSQITKWEDWFSSTSNSQYGYVKNAFFERQDVNDELGITLAMICKNVKNIADVCLEHYSNKTGHNGLKLQPSFHINKYIVDANMGLHVDSEDPTDSKHPVVSGVLYLNDNYTGGEIYFPEQDIKIKPEAGSLIMFPSYRPYFHHPLPVTEGTKYMIPFFWYE